MTQLEYQHNRTPSASMHSGISANISSIYGFHYWIINSEATDHMAGSHTFFLSYSTCSSRDKVRIADESLSSLSGKVLPHFRIYVTLFCVACSNGNWVHLWKNLSDCGVKLLTCNPPQTPHRKESRALGCPSLSISSITKHLNWSVTFPTYCILQNLGTSKRLAMVKCKVVYSQNLTASIRCLVMLWKLLMLQPCNSSINGISV